MQASYHSEYGWLTIDYHDEEVMGISFQEMTSSSHQSTAFSDRVAEEISEYFEGKRTHFTFRIKLIGTPFQKRVWSLLQQIPYGEVRSYQFLAYQLGDPKLARAVGMANHANPIAIVVPCHRVIGKNGQLRGYAYGVSLQRHLLEIEKKDR